jgi:hypothetical protein
LNAAKVIGTVRSKAKAVSALNEAEKDTRPGVAEFWQLDYERYDSVKEFCESVASLERVDAVVRLLHIVHECLMNYETFRLTELAARFSTQV